MTTHWYYQMMGAEFGPHTAAEMLELVRKHRLSPEDLVRKGEQGEWVAAYRIPGLFAEEVRSRLGGTETSLPSGGGGSGERVTGSSDVSRRVDRGHVPSPPPSALPGGHLAPLLGGSRTPATVQGGAERALADLNYEEIVDRAKELGSVAPPQLDWYCICHGEKMGPLTFRRLKELYAAGDLEPQGRVWSNASPKWCRAREVPGLE